MDPQDPLAIANSIRELVQDPSRAQEMGQAGRKAVERLYHWGGQWEMLRKMYTGTLDSIP